MRLGKRQIDALASIACPSFAVIVGDRVTASLIKRGLAFSADATGDFVAITSAGLRALADAMDAGLIKPFQQPKSKAVQ